MPNRINVLNDPVNYIDPLGLFDPAAGIESANKLSEAASHFEKGARAKEREFQIYKDILEGNLTDEEEINEQLREAASTCSTERKKGVKKGVEAATKAGEAIYSP